MRKLTIFPTMLLALLLAVPAFAVDIGDAKDRGWVGEMSTGYVGVVGNAPAEAAAVAAEVNTARRKIYQDQARKNGISITDVELIAAERNIARTRAGHFVHVEGRWVRKL